MKRKIQKSVHEVFNDGFLECGKVTIQRNEARKKTGGKFIPEGKLAFHLMNAREEDISLAGEMNSQLDLKLKTRFPPSFKTNRKKSSLTCRIEKIIYDVIWVDWDRTKSYLYFYLQEVGEENE